MPLTYRDRGTNGTQLDVLCGDIVIANVYKGTLSVTPGGVSTGIGHSMSRRGRRDLNYTVALHPVKSPALPSNETGKLG